MSSIFVVELDPEQWRSLLPPDTVAQIDRLWATFASAVRFEKSSARWSESISNLRMAADQAHALSESLEALSIVALAYVRQTSVDAKAQEFGRVENADLGKRLSELEGLFRDAADQMRGADGWPVEDGQGVGSGLGRLSDRRSIAPRSAQFDSLLDMRSPKDQFAIEVIVALERSGLFGAFSRRGGGAELSRWLDEIWRSNSLTTEKPPSWRTVISERRSILKFAAHIDAAESYSKDFWRKF